MPAAARFLERREEGRRRRVRALVPVALAFSLWHCATARARRAPRGKPAKLTDADRAAMARLGKELKARIVWSTSRTSGKHDIFIMNADGSAKKPLTKSNHVDWFPRFSPDGRRVLFTRSKPPWTSEAKCNRPERWNVHVIDADGTGEKILAKSASWADWTHDGKKVIFARGHKAFALDLASGKEEMLLDGKAQLKGALLQQPQPSPDGNHLAITLRGRRRAIGIRTRARKTWARGAVGGGCQMSWFPSGDGLYWVNLTGNRGTEIFRTRVKDGRSVDPKAKRAALAWVDLPGRRSHEYFPRVSRDGKWLVWCATDYGHDHDIYDYEVFCWRVGRPIKEAVRLTFHKGNDRWPDIFVVDKTEGAAR